MRHRVRPRSRLFAGAFLALSALVVVACAPTGTKPIVPTAPEPGPPGVPNTPATLSAASTTMWQTGDASGATSGGVWSLAIAPHTTTLFAGGDFTSVRAPGTAINDPSQRTAQHVTAFDTTTGIPVSTFAHSTDGKVSAMTISPDGSTLYIGGLFTKVDNQARGRVAAFDLTHNGYPLLPFNPGLSAGEVRAIAVSADSSAVFVGGTFSKIGSSSTTTPLARFSAGGGAWDPSWAPALDLAAGSSVNAAVNALLIAPGGAKLIVGGNFNRSNGVNRRALTSLVAADAGNAPIDPIIPTYAVSTRHSDVKALTTDGSLVYVGAEGTGGGVFDGTTAFNPATGAKVWLDNCLGATQAVSVVNGILYVGSHAHDCSAVGGFGQLPVVVGPASGKNVGPASYHHLLGEQAGTGKLLDWFPSANVGPNPNDPNQLGPRAMATDGVGNLFVGGEFTQINGFAQEGVARFLSATRNVAPRPVTSLFGSLLPGGKAVLDWLGTWDPDNGALRYKVYRDGRLVKVIGPVQAHFWQSGVFQFRDSGLDGRPHRYQVDALDAAGNQRPGVPITVNATGRGYAPTIQASNPLIYWRLAETTGTLANDSTPHGNSGTYAGAMNRGIPGAVPGNPGIRVGPTGNVYSNMAATTAPTRFSAAVWIRTTSTTGGRLLGFGNSQAGASTRYDRVLYLNASGQLLFGTHLGGWNYLWSPLSYNDGNRHYVVAEFDPSFGMLLYVDGNLVATNTAANRADTYAGWWRVGPDTLTGPPVQPTTPGVASDIDEVAVFPGILSQAQIRAQMVSQ